MMDKPTILIVDDTPENLTLMNGLLKDDYEVQIATNGAKALSIVSHILPDLILLDIMMADMDGYEVCARLKADKRTKDIPVIFLTAKANIDDETKGLSLGAVDYITKPISPPIVLARVKNQLLVKQADDFLRDKNAYLESEVAKRTKEVSAIQNAIIIAMASLAETRDNETGNHLRRTQNYVKILAEQLQKHPKYRALLDENTIAMLHKSAPLHDIGKVGIPDHILLKPGKLTDEEFAIMKTHTSLGRDAIMVAEASLGNVKDSFLNFAREIAYSHQEKYDGSGYPQGLKGEEIPLSARIMALADVYDALISRRVYKSEMSHEEAAKIIFEGKGKHFDPLVVEAFEVLQEKFMEIAERLRDKTK